MEQHEHDTVKNGASRAPGHRTQGRYPTSAWPSRRTRVDVSQRIAQFAARRFQLEPLLQVDPYIGRRTEVTAEAQSGVRGHAAHMQALLLQYGLDPAHPLADKLSPRENAALASAAQTAGVPGGVRTLQIMRPWLAALTLAVTPLLKAGLDPAHGVDKLLKAQMLAAGKPVDGLETAGQQIRFLADLPPAVELAFLRATLHDADQGSTELTELIGAWKAGDTAAIARLEDEDLRQREPQLYQRLLVERNRHWAGKIAAMLQKPGTVFIAVGAAHLAGPDRVQAQLRKLGIEAVRE
ncbi:MAG: TraB/GumN family protein [Rhodanobacter sp.]|nr:MAG: TraB/GumN family protein [Rhodanobacter sp.]